MRIFLGTRIRSIAATAAFLSFGIGTAMSAESVEGFFVVKEFKQGQKGVVLRGDIISPGKIRIKSGEGQESKAALVRVKPREVKWILPPKTSEFYDDIKSTAASAGYDTVEHEDFNYPSR